MRELAFIGVGIMGKSLVRNLMKAGFRLTIYSRTKSKCEDVIAEGAVWADSVADCVKGAEAVCTIVGYPKDVEEVYFGANGILEHALSGACLIDMTTTSPALSERIYAAGKAKGLRPLDAPVTGGDTGAKAGTLSIFVGGDAADFEACMPLFEAMGKTIAHMGGAGCGQHAKMANQIAIAGALAGASEMLAYARAKGLDPERLLPAVSAGSAGSFQMTNMAPKMIAGDFAPGFIMSHFIKDMTIARGEALRSDVTLPMLEQVLSQYRALEAEGLGSLGTQGLIKYYEQ
jgi:3-hydroxyisobutyrate dehydrogenase